MSEARLSVRVDAEIKRQVEAIFHELGMTMSTGINLYLNQVARQRGIPFPLTQMPQDKHSDMELRKQMEEYKAQTSIELSVKEALSSGVPVALFDDKQKRPFMQYPDGRQVYEIDE